MILRRKTSKVDVWNIVVNLSEVNQYFQGGAILPFAFYKDLCIFGKFLWTIDVKSITHYIFLVGKGVSYSDRVN